MAKLDMHNLQSYKVRIYVLCNFFQLLLVKTMSNNACLLPIQICDPLIHILCQENVVVHLIEITFNNNKLLLQLYVQKLECKIHWLLQ